MSSSSCCSSSSHPTTVEKSSDDGDFQQPNDKAEKQNRHNNNNSNISLDESVGCHSFDSAHNTLVQVLSSDIRTEISAALISHGLLASMITCVIVGWAYPKLGAYYVLPDITANWIAVIIIFFISGLSMDTATIIHAGKNVKFNTFIQVFNFGFVSAGESTIQEFAFNTTHVEK